MLLMLASLATQAQDVYEYASVVTLRMSNTILLSQSFSNGDYKEQYIDVSNTPTNNNSSVLKVFSEMSESGWEVIDMAAAGMDNNLTKYLLKRKVK